MPYEDITICQPIYIAIYIGSVDVHIIVGVSYTTVLISEVPRIHKHRKHALLTAPLNHHMTCTHPIHPHR